jgi:hypothetical protein
VLPNTSLQRTRRQSLRSFLLAAELDIVRQRKSERVTLLASESQPEPGQKCSTCGLVVPAFSFLAPADRASLLLLIEQGHSIEAIKALRRLGVKELKHANSWVFHRGQPVHPLPEPAPCPHCGQPLRSPRAKQCRHCGRDWH